MLIPCSRNAHDEKVLVRRAQWDQMGTITVERSTSEL